MPTFVIEYSGAAPAPPLAADESRLRTPYSGRGTASVHTRCRHAHLSIPASRDDYSQIVKRVPSRPIGGPLPGTMQTDLHGTPGGAQSLRCLVGVEFFDVAEQQDLAVLLGKARDAVANLCPRFGLLQTRRSGLDSTGTR